MFNKIKICCKQEKNIFNNNKEEIDVNNKKMILVMCSIAIVVFFLLFAFSVMDDWYARLRFPYLIATIVYISLFFIATCKKISFSPVALLYLAYAFLLLYCCYTSRYITPDTASVIILALVFTLPLTILDRDIRLNLIHIFFVVIYCLFVIPYKEGKLVVDEFINIVMFTILSTFLGNHLRGLRIENINLKRQSLVRETTDVLTELFNRRKLFATLSELGRLDKLSAIAMLDVDRFKYYNDTYGHQKGDDCLALIGKCLSELSDRYKVTFYRYGGEEFAALIDIEETTDPYCICEEINVLVESLNISHEKSDSGIVTISVGLTFVNHPVDVSFEKLIAQADGALYQAKRNGRNQTFIYDDQKCDKFNKKLSCCRMRDLSD